MKEVNVYQAYKNGEFIVKGKMSDIMQATGLGRSTIYTYIQKPTRSKSWYIEFVEREVYESEMMTYFKIAQSKGISQATFYNRIHKNGWSLEDAANTPVQGKNGVNAEKYKKYTDYRSYVMESGLNIRQFNDLVCSGVALDEAFEKVRKQV